MLAELELGRLLRDGAAPALGDLGRGHRHRSPDRDEGVSIPSSARTELTLDRSARCGPRCLTRTPARRAPRRAAGSRRPARRRRRWSPEPRTLAASTFVTVPWPTLYEQLARLAVERIDRLPDLRQVGRARAHEQHAVHAGDHAAGLEQRLHDRNDLGRQPVPQFDDLHFLGLRTDRRQQQSECEDETPGCRRRGAGVPPRIAGLHEAFSCPGPVIVPGISDGSRPRRARSGPEPRGPSGSWSGRQTRRTSRPSL
ncbi:MAG: hypothetical protein MZV70_43215 [Desulfobacterales bacterium]|nr:hypothetical protein [Desulfobacterales bacterium]